MSLLREVLRQHDEVPPPNPVRHAEVSARIRRIRLRRRLVASGAALTAAAAVALVAGTLTGSSRQAHGKTTVAVQPASGLPEHFTASDGAEYTHLATARVSPAGPKKAKVTVPVTGKAIEVAATCDGGRQSRISPRTSVNGRLRMESSFSWCRTDMELKPVRVPAGATEVTIEFDATNHSVGSACVWNKAKTECVPQALKPDSSNWNLAVYELTPPAAYVLPGEPKPFPANLENQRLLATKTGMWPQDKQVTFQVVGRGRKLGIDQICTGALGSRLRFTLHVNGRDLGVGGNCGVWEKGPYPMAIGEFPGPKGKPVTVTLKWEMPGEPSERPVHWSAGLFERMK